MTDQPLNVQQLHDQLRRAILQHIKVTKPTKNGYYQIIHQDELGDLLPDRKISDRDREQMEPLVWQVFHELYLERIIVPGTSSLTPITPAYWAWYRITDHGRRILATDKYSPYDPDAYLTRLKSEIPTVDETIIQYVAESLQCLRMGCLLAAAVTLGCASEKAMGLLIEQFGEAISDRTERKKYKKQTSFWTITSKYKTFRKYLDSVANDLPKNLRDPLEPQLHGTFDLIRRIRNDAGHPTGEPITVEMIRASHIVFPGYCKYVYSLMDHFADQARKRDTSNN